MRVGAAIIAVVGCSCVVSPSRAAPEARSIVFVSPHVPDLETALRDALTAQLAGSPVEVVFEQFTADGAPLRRDVSEARSMASAHDAVGVFWLDAQTDKEWLVYLSEPRGDRVLVRRLTVEPGGVGAAVEAVAVIARQSTEALLAGQTIGMRPVELPPEPTLPVAVEEPSRVPPIVPRPRPERPHGLELGLSYQGVSPDREIKWQSGVRLAVAYRWKSGAYFGGGYALYAPSLVTTPGLAFEVTRSPFDVGGGFAFGHGRIVPALELRGMLELTRRHDVSATAPLEESTDSTRAAVFLSPRARLGYTVSPVFEIYVEGGADLAINGFSFVSLVNGQEHVLLDPLRVRPMIEVGCSFWP